MKKCLGCRAEKSEDEFYRYANSDKPRARCKTCINGANLARQAANPEKSNTRTNAWRAKNPGRTSANIRAWQIRNPERFKKNALWTRYRINFSEMWDAQEGNCASCRRPMLRDGKEPTSVCVDHDRSCCSEGKACGKCVRGLIHRNCNLVLGYAKDDIEVLKAAVSYLERWSKSRS